MFFTSPRLVLCFLKTILMVQHALTANISTAEELQSALDAAKPGDTINLPLMTYKGEFHVTSHPGIRNRPITIVGKDEKREVTTIVSEGTGIHITGDNFVIKNLRISQASIGINIEGGYNTITNVYFAETTKGLLIAGDNNSIEDCFVNSKELGIRISSGFGNKLEDCFILNHAGGIYSLNVDKQACCGVINQSSFKGQVNVYGNEHRFNGTIFKNLVNIQGCNNVLTNNRFAIGSKTNITDKCPNKLENTNRFPSAKSAASLILTDVIKTFFMVIFLLYK